MRQQFSLNEGSVSWPAGWRNTDVRHVESHFINRLPLLG
jgi:hypothetical protein